MAAGSIEEYVGQTDGEVRTRLETVLALVRAAVPEGTRESIRWRMPAFMLGDEPLFFVTAAKRHLGFSPTSEAIEHFSGRLANYETTEHVIRLPHARPLPLELVGEIVRWRLARIGASSA